MYPGQHVDDSQTGLGAKEQQEYNVIVAASRPTGSQWDVSFSPSRRCVWCLVGLVRQHEPTVNRIASFRRNGDDLEHGTRAQCIRCLVGLVRQQELTVNRIAGSRRNGNDLGHDTRACPLRLLFLNVLTILLPKTPTRMDRPT